MCIKSHLSKLERMLVFTFPCPGIRLSQGLSEVFTDEILDFRIFHHVQVLT